MIYYSIDIAKKIKLVNEVYVSTDSERIKKISVSLGAKVPFLRPKKYSEDNSSDLQVFKHFYNWYTKKNKKIDLILHLRPTTPFRSNSTVIKAIKLMLNNPSYSSLRTFSKSDFSPFKTWTKKNSIAKPLFRKIIKGREIHSLGRQLLPTTYKHIGYLDIINPELTIKNKSMVGKKFVFSKLMRKKRNLLT